MILTNANFISEIKIKNPFLWKRKIDNSGKIQNIYAIIDSLYIKLFFDNFIYNESIEDNVSVMCSGIVWDSNSFPLKNLRLNKEYNLVWFDGSYYLGSIEFLEFERVDGNDNE